MTDKVAVFAIYDTREAAEWAVSSLKAEGFRNADISVLYSAPDAAKEMAHINATKAPEGVTTGAVSGAAVGGALGWLAGIGSLVIPGVGPFIAAGPIMAALAGGTIGGTIGGLTGGLIGYGIPEYEARRYESRLNNGGVLLSVHADNSDWASKAKEVLERTGGQDISKKKEVPASKAA